MTTVRIVDYGIGNLHSVYRAMSIWSDDVRVVSDCSHIPEASHLVLPGVGAFGTVMEEIRRRGLEGPLHSYAESGRPILGLCVGMQILATDGYENGHHSGLGLVPGSVTSLHDKGDGAHVPNMGWRDVSSENEGDKSLCITGTYYFAHSFEFRTDESSHVIATTIFGDHTIVAAIRKENVWGFQFHPEKSATFGLRLLSSFLKAQ